MDGGKRGRKNGRGRDERWVSPKEERERDVVIGASEETRRYNLPESPSHLVPSLIPVASLLHTNTH